MTYQVAQEDVYEEQAYRDACVRYPYREAEVFAFSRVQEMTEQVYAECFVTWLQVNE